MSTDVTIGNFTYNCGYYKVYDSVLTHVKERYDGNIEESYGLGALHGLTGWEAISVLEDGLHEFNKYGREPIEGDEHVMLRIGQLICACIRSPYELMRVY